MHDAIAEHWAIGSYHLSDGHSRGDLDRRNTSLFEFRRDRSAAARTGPSRRSEDDRVDAEPFGLLGHFPSHPAGIR